LITPHSWPNVQDAACGLTTRLGYTLAAHNANLFEIRMFCPGSGNTATNTRNIARIQSSRATRPSIEQPANPRTVKSHLPGLGEPVLMDLPFVSKIVRGFVAIAGGALWKE
jgi:hypothetical protein